MQERGSDISQLVNGRPNPVMYESERDECIGYELPFANIPIPRMWNSVTVQECSKTVNKIPGKILMQCNFSRCS